METKEDPFTGELFYPKRSNQLFASRKNQIAFNNSKAKINRDKIAPINKHLKSNWLILSKILGMNKAVIKSKDFLLGAGFNFSFYNKYETFNNHPYYGIYDVGIRVIENNKCEIVKLNSHE